MVNNIRPDISAMIRLHRHVPTYKCSLHGDLDEDIVNIIFSFLSVD